jgi:hypothetical protein
MSRVRLPVAEQQACQVRVEYRSERGELLQTTLDHVLVDALLAGLPVREFRWHKGQRHYSGWYWAATMGRLLAYESRLELARIMLADLAAEVVGIATQPFRLVGQDGGRTRRHVPDILLVDADGGVTVVDVKAPDRLADPEVQGVFAWTRAAVALRGWAFQAWAGAPKTLLDNVRFLAGYRRRTVVEAGLLPAVLEAAGEQATLGGVERALAGRHPALLVRPAMLHLVWSGALRVDLQRPLSLDSRVQLAGEAIG